MRIRPEVTHAASVLVLSVAGAVLIAGAYLHVHGEIATVEQAQGYVDPTLASGVFLGFVVMVVGVVLLAAIACWSGAKLVRALRTKQH